MNERNEGMKREDEAIALHAKGCNCAQSVLLVFAKDFSLDESAALKVSSGFGGGMGRMGGTCGAATGAFMVLGLARGMRNPEDSGAKEASYAAVQDFSSRFTRGNATLLCREMLGVDLRTPEGQKKAREEGLFATRCNKYIADAVRILEEMLGM
jgi:C_GCAxxG_C_C family probable redox protein